MQAGAGNSSGSPADARLAAPGRRRTLAAMPRPLRIGFAGAPGCDRPHLSVDGMTEAGPNLSHWPGNRTPKRFKADLSTGICLLFARASEAERDGFLGDAEAVLNDHYDTDGFLSMLAVARPEVALAREELCLAAAATGDYGAWQGRRAFAVDRIVAHLAAPRSPLAAQFAGLDGPAKSLARYRWLIDHAETVLDDPDSLRGCWQDECDAVLDELARARDGALQRRVLADFGLSLLWSEVPLRRITLNSLAGAFRVLHTQQTAEGPRYRFHDRTESWFEVVSFTPLPRRDLRELATRLNELEGSHGGGIGWFADPPDAPIPELWFGRDTPQDYGEVTRELAPSRLPPSTVAAITTTFFAEKHA